MGKISASGDRLVSLPSVEMAHGSDLDSSMLLAM